MIWVIILLAMRPMATHYSPEDIEDKLRHGYTAYRVPEPTPLNDGRYQLERLREQMFRDFWKIRQEPNGEKSSSSGTIEYILYEPTETEITIEAYYMSERGEGINDVDRWLKAKEKLTIKAKFTAFEVKASSAGNTMFPTLTFKTEQEAIDYFVTHSTERVNVLFEKSVEDKINEAS